MLVVSPSLSARDRKPPARLGSYEVGAKVGGGGMANVYVGRYTTHEGTEELVALKVIRDEYGDDLRFVRMFSDEARILERIDHKHVIRTIDYGIEREHRFIVMELLAGRTLGESLEILAQRNEPFPLVLGAWVCARIAEGLHAVHELTDAKGESLRIVHRDVNPTNIFLTHTGDVKLIDFGLAKARIGRYRTSGGMVKGKIPYLAPESLEMKPPERRVDIYALGTTLWELGTMRRLFKRDNDLETLAAVKASIVPDPRSIVGEYPDALARIVLRALQRSPDERYPTADAFRADLDAFIACDEKQMMRELGALLSRLFPGESTKHATWLDESLAVPIQTVAPPPIPIPVASSNMLDADIEVGEAEIDLATLSIPRPEDPPAT